MNMTEYNYKVGTGCYKIIDSGSITRGTVNTPHGMVEVYGQSDESQSMTSLRFQLGDTIYVRNFDKKFTHRGMSRKAKEFSEWITLKINNLSE